MRVKHWLALSIGIIVIILVVLTGYIKHGEKKEVNKDTNEHISSITEIADSVFKFKIKNNSDDNVDYHFTSGQRYDFEIMNSKGKTVHVYSSTAMFMQATGIETIAAGDSLVYELELSPLQLQPGNYKIKVWLTTDEGKIHTTEQEIKII